jgi:predicted nucleic acid-binding protein
VATRLFVDTSGFYALADRSDRHHLAARSILDRRSASEEWITTDHVVVESWLLLNARLGYRVALAFWDAIASGLAVVAGLSSADLVRARALAGLWRDQELSLVDCTSFAFIERLGLERALAYDAHFRLIRLGPDRRRKLKLAGE